MSKSCRPPCRWQRLIVTVLTALSFGAAAAYAGEPETPPAPKPAEKPKGPDHNVSLSEEPGVNELFLKAKKARARAETDPEVWPECVKCYLDVLKKYRNSVYLERWEGADNSEPAYKNGLYRSARERAMKELATLPPAALAVYRVIAEPAARGLYQEAKEQFDARKMEQVARDYPLTPWGEEAQVWLALHAFERGAWKEAAERFLKAAEHPLKSITPTAALAQALLAQVHEGDKAAALKTWGRLSESARQADKGVLRIGAVEGNAALQKLKTRVDAMEAGAVEESRDGGEAWNTIGGNAAHTQLGQARTKMGLRKWSVRLEDLLYGPGNASADVTGNPAIINQFLTLQDGVLHLNDERIFVAYPANDPRPGNLSAGGNAVYQLPIENRHRIQPNKLPDGNVNQFVVTDTTFGEHPCFTTLVGGRAYGIVKNLNANNPMANAMAMARIRIMGQASADDTPKDQFNYLVCIGRSPGGRDSEILWALKPGEPCFAALSPADQDWLRSVVLVSAPVYDGGVLYLLAVATSGTQECSAAAVDAETGRLLWTTPICSSNVLPFFGLIQPDRALPVAVADNTVYAVTNLGAVAALEARSGQIKWIRVYDRLKARADPFGQQGDSVQVRDLWGPNPPIVSENRLIVAPQDSDRLYVYDVETGARLWEISRRNDPDNPDERGLRYILGVIDGVLVATGTDIRFLKIKSGKRVVESIVPEGNIVGRGTLTSNGVLVCTDKGLVQVEIKGGENVTVGAPRLQEFAEPAIESGNVYSLGGMLYTLSHTHLNAYFIWEEMEAQLRQRLKENADDRTAHIELADIYRSLERFDDALAELTLARKILEKVGKNERELAGVDRRRFEALLSAGKQALKQRQPNLETAIKEFNESLEIARQNGQPDVFALRALQALADAYETQNNAVASAAALQEMIEKHGSTEFQFQANGTIKAKFYARSRLATLQAKNPASYAAIEKKAGDALAAAQSDPVKLLAVTDLYPASESAGKALLMLCRMNLRKAPDRTRLDAGRYLATRVDGADAAEVLALLAVADERLGLLAAAKDALKKLATADAFKDAKINPEVLEEPKGEPIPARQWAAQKLENPVYKNDPSRSVFSLGTGKLNPLWNRPSTEKLDPLLPRGVAPLEMRRAVFFTEEGGALVALAGRTGEEVWKGRMGVPDGVFGACWHERLLVLFGTDTIAAFDSADGSVAWSHQLKGDIPVQPQHYFWKLNAEGIYIAAGEVILALDPGSGQQMWRNESKDSFFAAPPVCGRGYVACASVRGNRLFALDAATGSPKWSVMIEPLGAPMLGGDERIYVPQLHGKLSVIDPKDGKKLLPDYTVGMDIHGLRETGDSVVLRLGDRELASYGGAKPGLGWKVEIAPGDSIVDFIVDGDDVLVMSANGGERGTLACYSIRAEGKFRWKQSVSAAATRHEQARQRLLRMQMRQQVQNVVIRGQGQVIIQNFAVNQPPPGGATEFDNPAGGWLEDDMSREHMIALQSNWDLSGDGSKVAVLVDRATGKAVWDAELKTDILADGTQQSVQLQIFDGGIVLCEARGLSAFGILGGGETDDGAEALRTRVAADATDFVSRRKLAALDFHKGNAEKALSEMAAMLEDPRIDAPQFSAVYRQFAELRREFARTHHAPLSFKRVSKPPGVDAAGSGWDAVAGQKFDHISDIYSASEEPSTKLDPSKETWRGPEDLSAVFKGAYDDKNLYIQIAVTDDTQRNDQTESAYIELGDALTLAFDSALSGGMGYRGETFELILGLDKNSKPAGWRRLEHGRYLRGRTPLEKDFSVTRDEEKKLTTYRIALPLEYLGLKSEAGRQFGLNFAVHDQDKGVLAEKHLCASPGLVGTREPRYFARGVFEK